MSSRLRPQEFDLSLEKSKHTERCAECVTQPTRMLARLTAAVARTLEGPAWHKTPRYAEHFNDEPVRGGAVPHRSDTFGRYSGVARIWVLHQIPIHRGPMGDGGLAIWPWGYPIPRARVGATDMSSQTEHIIQSQPGRSFGTKANFFASCMSLISKSKMRKWEVSKMEESPRSKSHSGSVQEQSASKSKQV